MNKEAAAQKEMATEAQGHEEPTKNPSRKLCVFVS
jgi:hypothetical protein